ncbi:MAG TPA: TIGR00645 family protein [Caulobacteraceae bacterium]|jgi:uncharacterized protein (TIGR00645 family)
MADPVSPRARNAVEHLIEMGVFGARWLMAPFYLGLIVMLGVLLVVFGVEFAHGVVPALRQPEEAIMLVLSLIDLSLAGNLLLIVIFSGYENFVSKIDTRGHEDRPEWMGTVDFTGMKLKLIGSIVAISAISLLRSFMRLAQAGGEAHGGQPVEVHYDQIMWMVILHAVFVLSGVLFALMDWISVRTQTNGNTGEGRAA